MGASTWTGYREIVVRDGPKGRVVAYERPNGRAPALQVFDKAPTPIQKRLYRICNRFAWHGFSIADNDTFKRNTNDGQGLWVLKAHDHRVYAFRENNLADGRELLVLLSGWVKDKDFTIEERHNIASAQRLRQEYLDLVGLVPYTVVHGTLGALSHPYLEQPLYGPSPQEPQEPQPEPVVVPEPEPETAPPEVEPPPVPQPKEEPVTIRINSTQEEIVAETVKDRIPYFHITKAAEVPYIWAWENFKRGNLKSPDVGDVLVVDCKNRSRVCKGYYVTSDQIDEFVAQMRDLRKKSGKPFGTQQSTGHRFFPFSKSGAKPAPQTELVPTVSKPTPTLPKPLVTSSKGLVSVRGAARMSKLSVSGVHTAVTRGFLVPVYRDHKTHRIYFRKEDVAAWVASTHHTSGHKKAKPVSKPPVKKPTLLPKVAVEALADVPLSREALHTLLDDVLTGKQPVEALVARIQEYGKARDTIRDLKALLAEYEGRLG